MKTRYTVALSMVAGAALGGAAIQGLHAQAKPPVHYVAEIDVTNPDAYAKEYAPKAQALIKAAGGKPRHWSSRPRHNGRHQLCN